MAKISILIPCWNEEKTIAQCVQACLNQTRKPDEIVVVNDASTDRSREILLSFGDQVKLITLSHNSGNKSYAQKEGLNFVTGDIFITTDADTILDSHFVERAEKAFEDENIAAFAGYVKSLKSNWLTACREVDYVIGQTIHKKAQSEINALFVIPGCAGAFRTELFRKYITFDHDTLTEDLDFTYKLHKNELKIAYDTKAIAYTQDPNTLAVYKNQMRRWYSGGWQNLLKHKEIVLHRPQNTLELLITYLEGLVFSLLLFITPAFSLYHFLLILIPYIVMVFIFASYAAIKDRRLDLVLAFPGYLFLIYFNAWIFLEQFVREIILKERKLVWYHPERRVLAS